MENRVAILGTGCTLNPGRQHLNQSFKDLIVESCYKAINDSSIEPMQIEAASFSYSGEGEVGHGGIGPTLVNALGLSPIPAYVSSANCTSGHTAFIQGCNLIASGKYKIVLVAGFDKASDVIPFQDYMLISSDSLYDYHLGYSHIDSVLLQEEYFRLNNISGEMKKKALMKFATMMRENGSEHPVACYYKKKIPTEQQLSTLPYFGNLMTSGEGSAAIILTTEENSRKYSDNPVYVAATSYVTTSHYAAHQYDSQMISNSFNEVSGLSKPLPLKLASDQVYREAGIDASNLDTIQLYDQGVNSLISIEACGLAKQGRAVDFILSGKGDIDGECPINTDGGNIGRGFAGGTAGIYPIIELFEQLNGNPKGKEIVKEVKYGLSTFAGGPFAHAAAILLKKDRKRGC